MLSEDEARRIARRVCERRGLSFDEPVIVTRGPFRTRVWTNADFIGGYVSITLDSRTGAVVDVRVSPG